jgi:hypothetical protein
MERFLVRQARSKREYLSLLLENLSALLSSLFILYGAVRVLTV